MSAQRSRTMFYIIPILIMLMTIFSAPLQAQTTGTIQGTLYDATTNQPIADTGNYATDAWVSMFDTNNEHIQGTSNDENGQYILTDIEAGEYLLRAAGVFYVAQYYNEGGPQPDENTETVTLSAGQTLTIDFYLQPGGVIFGTVTDSDSNGLSNMDLHLDGFPEGACSEEDGSYAIPGIAFDTPVRVVATGMRCGSMIPEFMEEYWDDQPNYENATILTLTAQTRQQRADFTLDTFSGIVGTIYDNNTQEPIGWDGSPENNVYASLFDATNGQHIKGTGTNTNGNYALSAYPGDYTLEFGGGQYLEVAYDGTATGNSDFSQAQTITISEGQVVNIDIYLQKGVVISGTVYESDGQTPLNSGGNQWVNVLDATTEDYVGGTGVNEQDGTYSVAVAPGNYLLVAGAEGYLREFYDEAGLTSESASTITVSEGTPITGIDFTLDQAGSISGRIVDVDGNSLANINVGLADYSIGTCTNGNGEYSLDVPVDTPLDIFAGGDFNWCNGPENFWQTYWDNVRDENEATAITVPSINQPVTGINLTLHDLNADLTPPHVSNTTPTQLTEQVDVNANISMTFDESVRITKKGVRFICQPNSVPVFGKVTRSGNTFTLNPRNPMPMASSCQLMIPVENVRDNYGNNLVDDDGENDDIYTLRFYTDAPPELTSDPANNAEDVPTESNIVLQFSEEVEVSKRGARFACSPGGPVRVGLRISGNTYTLVPRNPLPDGAVCTFTLPTANVTDATGNELVDNETPTDGTYTLRFTTAASASSASIVVEPAEPAAEAEEEVLPEIEIGTLTTE